MGMLQSTYSRRTVLTGIAGGLSAGLLTGTIPAPATGAPAADRWAQPGSNAGGTNAQLQGTGPAGALSVDWKGNIGGYSGDPQVGAVVDGTVYASGSVLVAKNVETGTTKWSAETKIPDIENPDGAVLDVERPTYVNGVVIAPVRIGVFDGDGAEYAKLMGVDAKSGEKRWEKGTKAASEFSNIRAEDGTCYMCGPDLAGGDAEYVYQFAPSDGEIGWKQSISLGNRTEYHTPAITGNRLFIAEQSGVVALDTNTGERIWKQLPNVKQPHVDMVDSELLLVSEDTSPGATVIALDPKTGEERWKQAYAGEHIRIRVATMDTEQVYVGVGVGKEAPTVVGLDRTDGSELWTRQLTQWPDTAENEPLKGKPNPTWMARVGSYLYAGGFVLDPADGSVHSTIAVDGPWTAPYRLNAVAEGKLFFGGQRLLAVNGAEQQTSTPPATEGSENPDSDGATGTTNPQQGSSAPTATTGTDDSSVPSATDSRGHASSATDETTATNGPGFTIPAAIAALGVAGWRRRR